MLIIVRCEWNKNNNPVAAFCVASTGINHERLKSNPFLPVFYCYLGVSPSINQQINRVGPDISYNVPNFAIVLHPVVDRAGYPLSKLFFKLPSGFLEAMKILYRTNVFRKRPVESNK